MKIIPPERKKKKKIYFEIVAVNDFDYIYIFNGCIHFQW